MAEVRLQKFLAECGVGSRRKMERFIIEGRVQINGKVCTELGRKIDPDVDKIEVNRRPVHAAPKGIMLLNKPRGVVSTLSDPEGRRTVADFLTKHYQSYFPVGRLDWDSTGLMILTNDGEIAERLMHPRFGFERVYQARVEGSVEDGVLQKIQKGVRLSDGFVQASATVIKNDENTTWLEVRIREGRNRVIRRLFDKLGHSVMKLKRTVYGPFKIGNLQVGQVRVLTMKEYEQARRKVMHHQDAEPAEVAKEPTKPTAPARAGRSRSDFGEERRDRRDDRTDRRDERRGRARPAGGRSKPRDARGGFRQERDSDASVRGRSGDKGRRSPTGQNRRTKSGAAKGRPAKAGSNRFARTPRGRGRQSGRSE
jgi:23S rRNA pseudouridine2605 synthase